MTAKAPIPTKAGKSENDKDKDKDKEKEKEDENAKQMMEWFHNSPHYQMVLITHAMEEEEERKEEEEARQNEEAPDEKPRTSDDLVTQPTKSPKIESKQTTPR